MKELSIICWIVIAVLQCVQSLHLKHSLISRSQSVNTSPTVFLLHGLLGSRRNFHGWADHLYSQLGKSVDIYTVDMRNHGASPHDCDMSYVELARDVVATMDQCGVNSAHIVGHSMGGKVGAAVAAVQQAWGGNRVASLTMLDIMPVVYSPEEFSPVYKAVDILKQLNELAVESKCKATVNQKLLDLVPDISLVQFIRSNMLWRDGQLSWNFNLDAICDNVDNIANFPSQPMHNTYDGEVLILQGGKSEFVVPSRLRETTQLFPRTRIETIPDAGHWVHIDKPEETASIVAAFIRSVAKSIEMEGLSPATLTVSEAAASVDA